MFQATHLLIGYCIYAWQLSTQANISCMPPALSHVLLVLAGIEDPDTFFHWLMTRPYAQNVVWGPHFYAQSVVPFPLPKAFLEVSTISFVGIC